MRVSVKWALLYLVIKVIIIKYLRVIVSQMHICLFLERKQ